jgi:uncharacterized lipoprotein YehR (DUF1307 family)
MKKLIIGISIIQFILTMVLLFIIVSLSACNIKGNVSMDGKGMIVDQLNGLNMHIEVQHISDTIHKAQSIGDFRYDYMLK